jgi:hypothetical protein
MKSLVLVLSAAAVIGMTAPAIAHHSAAPFDFTIRDAKVTGVVKEFEVANPHTKIVLMVSDDKGPREIEFEGHSRNNYYRQGWRPALVKVGDTITLLVAPRKDGTDGGYALNVIAADGTEF